MSLIKSSIGVWTLYTTPTNYYVQTFLCKSVAILEKTTFWASSFPPFVCSSEQISLSLSRSKNEETYLTANRSIQMWYTEKKYTLILDYISLWKSFLENTYFKRFSDSETFSCSSKNQIVFRNKIYRIIKNIYLCQPLSTSYIMLKYSIITVWF